MRKIRTIGLAIIALLVMTTVAQASIGIGLGCGFRFEMGDLRKGQSYHLGQMCLLNTGDQPGCYKMDIGYRSGQAELRAPKEWVRFEPSDFCLEPCDRLEGGGYSCPFDQAQKLVQVYLDIPKNARKGDYFAYLMACTDSGGTVGACVASKLSFIIVPGRANGLKALIP